MSQINFPPLRLAVLQGLLSLKERYDEDPKFLRDKSCPYDIETVEVLERILTVKVVEKVIEKVVKQKDGRGRKATVKLSAEDETAIEATAKDLLDQLKTLGDEEKGLEVSERIQIIKAKAALVEQVLKIRERMYNVKQVSEFQTVVIGILDDLITEDRRDAFLDRIEPYLN